MMNIEIEPGIIIDKVEELIDGLNTISSIPIEDMDTVLSFIKEEKHTKFFINNKLHSQMVEEDSSVYLWLDSGLINKNGSPIFISLLKSEGRYIGHYYGTAETLSKSVKEHFYRNRKDINENLVKFKRKYEKRVKDRTNRNLIEEGRRSENQEKPTLIIKEKIEKVVPNAVKNNQGNKIILDLEFCRVDAEQKEMKKLSKFETIQFGAVKLDANNEIIGRYESFVKPRYSHIDETVSKLTNITDEIVSSAPDYIEIINGFLDWAGDTCTVFSWSTEDLRLLRKESRQKGFTDARLDKMFENWVDLQKSFGEEVGVKKQISLSNAVKSIGREFEGVQHSAINDAENTAYIFQEMQTDNFKEKYKELFDLFKPTEGLTVSIGSLFADLMKQVECVG